MLGTISSLGDDLKEDVCRLYANTVSFYKGLEHPWILVSARSFPQLNAEGQVSTLRVWVIRKRKDQNVFCCHLHILYYRPFKNTTIAAGHPSMNLMPQNISLTYMQMSDHASQLKAINLYHDVNIVTIRENTEGEYSGIEHVVCSFGSFFIFS